MLTYYSHGYVEAGPLEIGISVMVLPDLVTMGLEIGITSSFADSLNILNATGYIRSLGINQDMISTVNISNPKSIFGRFTPAQPYSIPRCSKLRKVDLATDICSFIVQINLSISR